MKPPADKVYQVSEFLTEARRLLEASYPRVWLEGEISSLRVPASGHAYFTLKDADNQVRCAMFRRSLGASRHAPADGDYVRVQAKLTIYTARGDMQLIVEHMEAAGEGLLLRRFEELKQKLKAEGLFDAERKAALPTFPATVGIISSPSGAAVRDIISTFRRRCPSIRLILYPSLVQGELAAGQLRAALGDALAHGQAEVLILARGGGSLEDLWCFNDEALAREIADCPLPVVSGVGHEIDTTICDLVADRRAPTPTGAAEMLSPDAAELRVQVKTAAARLTAGLQRDIQNRSQRIDWLQKRLDHPATRIQRYQERQADLSRRLQAAMRETLQHRHAAGLRMALRVQRLDPAGRLQTSLRGVSALAKRLETGMRVRVDKWQVNQRHLTQRLHTASPLATLERGYAVASRAADSAIVRSVSEVAAGDDIDLRVSDGSLRCRVSGEIDDA